MDRPSYEAAANCRHPLVALLLPTVAGITLDRWLDWPLAVWVSITLVAWLAAVGWRRRLGVCSAWMLLGFLALAASWHHVRWNCFSAHELGLRVDETRRPAVLRAVAQGYPLVVEESPSGLRRRDLAERRSLLTLRLTALRQDRVWNEVSGVARLTVKGELQGVCPGDLLEVYGHMRRPGAAANPGGRSWDEYERARRKLVRITADYPESVTICETSGRWHPRWLLAWTRHYGERALWRHLPRRQAELAAALLLGDREHLDAQRTGRFLRTGTIHLLAISGLHVTILAMGIYLLARLVVVRTSYALILVMLVTTVYSLIAGGRAPVVRAAILVYVVCLSGILRRDSLRFNSLAAAALVVLAINPCQLFEVGAQLSFLAVASMMWFLPTWTAQRPLTPLERLLARRRGHLEVWLRMVAANLYRTALASTVIWCLALPLVTRHFHLISPSALWLNLFLWVPIALALLSGFGVLVTSCCVPVLADGLGAVCGLSLECTERCVVAAESLPFSYIWVAGPTATVVLVFYLIVAAGMLLRRWHARWPIWLASAYVVFLGGLWGAAPVGSQLPLRCTFLSVGHGGCTVIELPNGEVWLYDAGSLGDERYTAMNISQFLWARGLRRIDTAIISHADVDHFNALPVLAERFEIGRVVVPPGMFTATDEAVRTVANRLAEAAIPIETVAAGTFLAGGRGAQFQILHPPTPTKEWMKAADNARCLVLHVRSSGKSILLTGDLEDEGMERLLSLDPLHCDVVMAPHHGSLHSQPGPFCNWCTPEVVVVSAGPQSSLVTTHAYRRAGCRVYHTALDGAVQVLLDERGAHVSSFRRESPFRLSQAE